MDVPVRAALNGTLNIRPTASNSSPTYIYLAPDTSPTVSTGRNRNRFCSRLPCLLTESQKNWNLICIWGEPSRHDVIERILLLLIRKGEQYWWMSAVAPLAERLPNEWYRIIRLSRRSRYLELKLLQNRNTKINKKVYLEIQISGTVEHGAASTSSYYDMVRLKLIVITYIDISYLK